MEVWESNPPRCLGFCSCVKLIRACDCHQMKAETILRIEAKYAGGTATGTVCMIYKILGNIDIFIIAALPNQQKQGLSQEASKDLMDARRGRKFREYVSFRCRGI